MGGGGTVCCGCERVSQCEWGESYGYYDGDWGVDWEGGGGRVGGEGAKRGNRGGGGGWKGEAVKCKGLRYDMR